MADTAKAWNEIRTFALSLPEAAEEFPWGESVIKVRKKIFIFLGQGVEPVAKVSLKLAESNAVALSVPGAVATGYNLGKAGWVTIVLGPAMPPVPVLLDWVSESYRLVAPKRLVAHHPTR